MSESRWKTAEERLREQLVALEGENVTLKQRLDGAAQIIAMRTADVATLKQERAQSDADFQSMSALHDFVADERDKAIAERDRLRQDHDDLFAERNRLRAAMFEGRQKLATYQSVYPGDKELRRLLTEWDAVLSRPLSPSETEEAG